MSVIDNIKTEVGDALNNVGNFIENNPITTAVGAGAVGSAAVIGVTSAILSSGSSGSNKTSKRKGKRNVKKDRRFKSKQKHEQRYKRKKRYKVYGKKGYQSDRSKKVKHKKSSSSRRKGVHYTKKGQPYILLRSGKARFIKKRSKK